MTIGNGGRVIANLNNFVLALIRQAGFLNAAQVRRYFAAHLSRFSPLFLTLLQPYPIKKLYLYVGAESG